MNRLIALLVTALLVVGLLTGCMLWQAKQYSDPSQTIEIGVGKKFIIALESNPTTGYTWESDFDDSYLRLVKSEYKSGNAAKFGMVGVGDQQRFTFEGLKEGRTEITLTYKRSWAQDFAEQKTFKVSIK